VEGRQYTFGVSGLLYHRNLLFYDRQTNSLWSQLGGQCVAGELAGTSLALLPATQTTWSLWKEQHPGTLVLSFHTGYQRDYSRDPYSDWPLDRSLALVVKLGGTVKLYPFSELKKAGSPSTDEFNGERLTLFFDARSRTASAKGERGEILASFVVFLADARAFYPHAPVFKAK